MADYDKTHRRFPTVAAYVNELGGDKGLAIEKVLIANNGNAAVKAIRSIRRWAYDVFGDERAISFVVMATPEDLRANAEYIRMGDVIADVPGGSNNNNYANVTLIVELARLHRVHAVWAGWGHASENPVLPDTLARSEPPIKFIGPAGPPMRALGDKIGSTIIAQSAGVPCIAWNGQHVKADYDRRSGCLPGKAFSDACIHSAQEALAAAKKIGFPIMIKASEGGGGKGIRKVEEAKDVLTAYRQVCGEVPGSPIFIMKLSSQSRHLEVQLLADEYGDALALNGRDCSVQRRHQKIIEEGPPVAASPEVWHKMEQAAVGLAKAVGYANAGTVEYLYSERDAKFYFLELNPRLQVEHPVTEMITKVNLPACQLQVAMGIPLKNIPDIRHLYGKNPYEQPGVDTKIDFDNTDRLPPYNHCIAVRITAENAEQGFKPTSGGIQELNFRSTPNVWGYFSMDSSGSIHEFADSQFGHLFASGNDREQARRSMVQALKELSIRGDIMTTVDYISKLLELEDFIDNRIDTAWLDGLIKRDALVDSSSSADVRAGPSSVHPHTHVIIGATISAFELCNDGEKQFIELLRKGQLPPLSLLQMEHGVELILDGIKYKLRCVRTGPSTFRLRISDTVLDTHVRVLSDGGYLIAIGGMSHVAYVTARGDVASGMRLSVKGASVSFSPDYDPTSLRTDVAGKLVKRLVEDGTHLNKGEPFAEIEVMKMFMPLKVDEAGVITWCANEGAALSPGQLMATMELENPDNVATTVVFKGKLELEEGSANGGTSIGRPHLAFRDATEKLRNAMAGYVVDEDTLSNVMEEVRAAVSDPTLPAYEIGEQLSVLSGRIDADLFATLSKMISDFKEKYEGSKPQDSSESIFPAVKVLELLKESGAKIKDASEFANFTTLTTLLRESATPYAEGPDSSRRALDLFLESLRGWIAAERPFCDGISYADAVDDLRKSNQEHFEEVLRVCRCHARSESTAALVDRIVSDRIVAEAGGLAENVKPCLSEIGSMRGNKVYAGVALTARRLLLKDSLPSAAQRREKVSGVADALTAEEDSSEALGTFMTEHVSMSDILFPALADSGPKKRLGVVEVYARRLYADHNLDKVERVDGDGLVKITFSTKTGGMVLGGSLGPVPSMSDLTRIVSRSSSLSNLDSNANDSEDSDGSVYGLSNSFATERDGRIPANTSRVGVFKIVGKMNELESTESFDALLQHFPQYSRSSPRCQAGAINVLHVYIVDETVEGTPEASAAVAERIERTLTGFQQLLQQADVRRVTFSVNRSASEGIEVEPEYIMPSIFTFRVRMDFREDSLFRDIEPSQAYHLDLVRLAKNFSVRRIPSVQVSATQVHLYKATPKKTALAKDKRANPSPRVFVRALDFVDNLTPAHFEKTVVDCLNAFDLDGSAVSGGDNHLFINLIGDEKVVLDPGVAEKVAYTVVKRQEARLSGLGVALVEIRVECSLVEDSSPIAIRLVASNPTGYVLRMSTYVEAADETNTKTVFKVVGDNMASTLNSGEESWERKDVDTPYPLTRPFDYQRKAAARSSDTLYCYDIPPLFEEAVKQQWKNKGGDSSAPPSVMFSSELVVQKKKGAGLWTFDSYVNGDLEMVQSQRGAGTNDVGMVAWLIVLKTVEYPNGRQLVVISNDITFKAGSFGTREDVVFKLASEYARERRAPRLYVAANSGARIGTADGVKKAFKVSFKNGTKPENGFNFLYVSKEDYGRLGKLDKALVAEPVTLEGEDVFKITDIIGTEPDLGVENLKGSGLIAGETSSAYNDIFTMTIVLGRTVGIGAYLVRLGQRTIQKKSSSPIILTGYQALNKLMGVDVYSTNDQLGGPGIMYNNGVSHVVADDHLDAIAKSVEWLSFVPSTRGGLLPITDIRGFDIIERTVDFMPTAGAAYDPRNLIEGSVGEDGSWQSGFFDKGSFVETLSGWAKSVVVGRARLGGIPMGVVATENRTVEAISPADPADAKASETVKQEAGCVWFPNSAYKTATAINDFRSEDLPLMIFANWRGFSGGQRDMFDEVLKYGSMIVDAFVAYQQPIFVLIPPHAEIRGGAWVVVDPSINSSVMEMYATSKTSRGGVLEANGAASVKYRVKDLVLTMHRLDDKLKEYDAKLEGRLEDAERDEIKQLVMTREQALLPVYEQIAVHFCDLHDTPGRMAAVGVIKKEIDWKESRKVFFWRLRRKLAEFDLRKKMVEACKVRRSVKTLDTEEASALMKSWFLQTPELTDDMWEDDKVMLSWMAQSYEELEEKVKNLSKESVVQEVFQVLTGDGQTSKIGTAGIVEGISRAFKSMSKEDKEHFKGIIQKALEE